MILLQYVYKIRSIAPRKNEGGANIIIVKMTLLQLQLIRDVV